MSSDMLGNFKSELDQGGDDLIDDLINIVQTESTSLDTNLNKKKNDMDKQELKPSDYFDEIEEDDDEEDEFDEEEIMLDEMLEKPIDILEEEKDQVNFYTYNKLQIKNIYWRGCQDTILPEGWVQVTHASGMPLFLNRQTRVCSLSRPYYIGQSSARKHEVPISSIPCLSYRQRKEAIDKQIKEHQQSKLMNKQSYNKNHNNLNNTDASNPISRCPFSNANKNNNDSNVKSVEPTAPTTTEPILNTNNKKVVVSIQTNEEKLKETILSPEQLNQYCKRLFEFDVIKVKKFKTWSDRKKFIRNSKNNRQQNQSQNHLQSQQQQQQQQGSAPNVVNKFPHNAKMLKIQTKTQKGINKELSINMTNKTSLSILYEYTNQIFKTNPRFEIQEKENPKDPFHAICYINDKVCGKGNGNSKKAAKNNAAEDSLCILIPEFKSQLTDTSNSASTSAKKNNDEMYSFFDGYNVEHTHIYLLSQKLGAPFPYDVLLTCLKYNFAINMSRNRRQFIEEEIKPIKYRNCLYRMKLAQYDVEVNCTKKKEGRQLAAQKILKQMHPHVQTWGSMLRLYGSKINESYLDSNNGEQQANDGDDANKTDLSSANNLSQKAKPNKELLEKLKQEMLKLKHKTSNTNSVDSSLPANSTGNENTISSDTLLTIPPLFLDNCEFKLSSDDFLMKNDGSKKNADKDKNDENEEDGKILFTNLKNDESADKNNNGDNYDENGQTETKKRKLNIYSDQEEDSDSESSDSDDSDTESSTSSSINSKNNSDNDD